MVRTDADSDLTNSLDHCLLTSTLARVDPRNGKWRVIAAGSAAQTAMVMVLEAQGDWKHFTPEDRGELWKFFDKLETDKDNEGDLRERHEAGANTSEPSHARLRSAYTTRSAGPETAATTSRVTARRLRTAMVSMGGPPTMNSSPQVTAKLGHCSSPGCGSDGVDAPGWPSCAIRV